MSVTGSGTATVEIVQSVCRRRWTSSQKLRMGEETMQPANSVSRIARQYGVSAARLCKWMRLMLEGGATAMAAEKQVVSMSEVAALKKWIAEFERVLGKKTNEVLKAAVGP